MKNELIERVRLDHEESFHVDKTSRLLNSICTEMPESVILDEQILPDGIEVLIYQALCLEDKRVWSVFNVLSAESRAKLRQAIAQRGEQKLEMKGDE